MLKQKYNGSSVPEVYNLWTYAPDADVIVCKLKTSPEERRSPLKSIVHIDGWSLDACIVDSKMAALGMRKRSRGALRKHTYSMHGKHIEARWFLPLPKHKIAGFAVQHPCEPRTQPEILAKFSPNAAHYGSLFLRLLGIFTWLWLDV